MNRHIRNFHQNITSSATQGKPAVSLSPPVLVSPSLIFQKTGTRDNKKFGTLIDTYSIKIKETAFAGLQDMSITTVVAIVEDIFTEIIDTLLHRISNKNDLVRFVIQSSSLDYPIPIPFTKKQNITVDLVLGEIQRVLQSYEEFVIDDKFEITLFHIALPHGARIYGKYQRVVNFDRFLQAKRCIIQIKNKDNLCCARAIVTAIARLQRDPQLRTYYNANVSMKSLQSRKALALHRKADVPLNPCGLAEVRMFQSVLAPKYQIYVVSKDHLNGIIYEGPHRSENKIFLYYHDNHYDIITSMPAFMRRSYYCLDCRKGFNNQPHFCAKACKSCFANCQAQEPQQQQQFIKWQKCNKCLRSFRSQNCFRCHLLPTKEHKVPTCKRLQKCPKCFQTLFFPRRPNVKAHVCGEIYCSNCQDYVRPNHLCFMKPVSLTKSANLARGDGNEPSLKYIFFDFECVQESGIHEPNLCIAYSICNECIDKPVNSAAECVQCGKNQRSFQGKNCHIDFCKWLFSEPNVGATCFAHNFKGYDSYFILQYLYANATIPKIIYSGTKIVFMTVPCIEIKFLDSYNFIPLALAKIPKAFDIPELAKGYWPHLFNTWDNQHKCLSSLPEANFYNPENMSAVNRKSFFEWYSQHQNDAFDFQAELFKYCESDVHILANACLKFRYIFMNMTSSGQMPGIDPFAHTTTIASASLFVYRSKFLQPDTIGLLPPGGYNRQLHQSYFTKCWLGWVEYSNSIAIQREVSVGPYVVDGLHVSDTDVDTVYEAYGCYYHGHPQCYSGNIMNDVCNRKMHDLYTETKNREHALRAMGYKIVVMWECEFGQLKHANPALGQFLSSAAFTPPIMPREAFFGGRCNATRLYYRVKDTEKIRYYDFCSLYPSVNKYCRYPIKHPTVIKHPQGTNVNPFFGLIKCKVLAPGTLFHPVLPVKVKGKLMFPLCLKCVDKVATQPCAHSRKERAFIGTWVSCELQLAVSKGYIILQIFEVWHYPESSQYNKDTQEHGLFSEYINTFLQMKQEASGWPDWVQTDDQKQTYISQYYDTEGISLNAENVAYNGGLRSIGKLVLNSLWGKMGQRDNLTQATHISDRTDFFSLLTDETKTVTNIDFPTSQIAEVQWQYEEHFTPLSPKTNIVLAAFTTAHARIKLYHILDLLQDRVLYTDTDSIIFVEDTNPNMPDIPLGDYLGDLTDELPKNVHITEFVSGGPKNYAYKTSVPLTSGRQTFCKIKGITLNFTASQTIHFETMKEMVLARNEEPPLKYQVQYPYQIIRDKKHTQIKTRAVSKMYQFEYDKRIIGTDNYTYPYGFTTHTYA